MLKEYLSTLANKFREILETTDKINAQDFAEKISDVFARGHQLGESAGYQIGLEKGIEQGKPLGKIELLQDSKYMNANVSGTAIAVNDVSPIEHSVGCTLTSDTITDFSTVEVTRYGKNLLSPEVASFDNWVNEAGDLYYYFDLPPGTYTFSCTLAPIEDNNFGYFYFQISNDNWATRKKNYYIVQSVPNVLPCTFTIENGDNCRFYWYGAASRYEHYSNFQIERGSVATPYELYVEPTTYTSTADGNVEGIKSISPSMTLLANNSNVVINANYLRDIDTYINNLITDVALSGGEA